MTGRPDRGPQADHAAWGDVSDVLCIRLDTIGDVLMTGPAMRALRERARVTLLTSSSGASVAELMADVDETIVYDAPWVKNSAGGRTSEAQGVLDRQLIERLAERRFDAAVIFTVYSQSALPAALLCHLAGIPLRLAHCREKPYALLTDWVPEPEPERLLRHEVRRQLDLVATVGARTTAEELRICLPSRARARAADLLVQRNLERGRWIAVHPGGTAPARRYPADLLAEVCATLANTHGLTLAFTGDPDDRELVEQVRQRSKAPSASFAGRLDLAELAALLESAAVLLCGNTGPAHLAAALGTPVVDLYALTNPQHTPWQVPTRVLFHDVPCRWCYSSVCPEGHHRCLRGVAPEQVTRAVIDLLQRPAADACMEGARQVADWGATLPAKPPRRQAPRTA
jgi:lipopolysaccharide heptosyltransferase II